VKDPHPAQHRNSSALQSLAPWNSFGAVLIVLSSAPDLSTQRQIVVHDANLRAGFGRPRGRCHAGRSAADR
jgi:hypothetical protein